MIELKGVSKTYHLSGSRRIEALKNVTIRISKGQSIVIGGPSGSGKSTLLNILGRLDHPSGGRIFHGEEDVTNYSEEELCRIRREKIGFIFQFYNSTSLLLSLRHFKSAYKVIFIFITLYRTICLSNIMHFFE